MTLDDAQKLIPSDVRLLEYFVTSKKLFIFYIDANDFEVFEVDISEADLKNKIDEFENSLNNTLRTKDLSDFYMKSNELYKLLIAPVFQNIKMAKSRKSSESINELKIIIIPHGPLHYLPFCALYNGDRYLIDSYVLITDPSASVLRFIIDKRKKFEGDILVLGNPKRSKPYLDLPETEKGLENIKNIMGNADIYLHENATETIFKEKSINYSMIHLSCHGNFNSKDPMLSSLLLSKDSKNDGDLMVKELFGLNLSKSSLVVLSACETGKSKVMKGDELIGLSRGFIYAGTPSLVATLWNIGATPTTDLMKEFYNNLKLGMSKPEALRTAQLWMKSQKKYENPLYWAPFIIIGDWE